MQIKTVNAQELKEWIDNDDAVLIDVREPMEFQSHHIAGALLHPLGRIAKSDLPDTSKKIVIYCQKGVRGNSACKKIVSNENEQIYNLEGGINAWKMANLPTDKEQIKVLSLDRQVQISIGTFVLLGSLGAIFVNTALIAIPIFFGAGLLFAGLSGSCGLAVLLAKMPWNQR